MIVQGGDKVRGILPADTYKAFNSFSIKPVKNKVIFLEPIMPEEYADMNTQQLAEEVKSRIIAKMEEFGVEQQKQFIFNKEQKEQ